MCLYETYSTVRIGKYESDQFPIHNSLEHGDAFSPVVLTLLRDTPLGGLREPGRAEIERDAQHLDYDDDVNMVLENIDAVKKNTETLLDGGKEVGIEVNPEKNLC
jgi:hypothetical protein